MLMAMPTPTKRLVLVFVRIDPALRVKLKVKAAKRGTSVQALLSKAARQAAR